MKKRYILALLLFGLCALTLFVLTSCGKSEILKIELKGPEELYADEFDLMDYDIVIHTEDGRKKEMLSARYLSAFDLAKLQTVGTHTFEVKYEGFSTHFTVNLKSRAFEGVSFPSKTYVYDGEPKSITLANLPSGVVVQYNTENTFTNVGEYYISVTITKENYVTETMSATMNIIKGTYDMSDAMLESKYVLYDGTAHTITVKEENLPEGVSVTYENNTHTNAGTYIVVAKFSSENENYHPIPDMTAVLEIRKIHFDMSGVMFASKTFVYDGAVHSIGIDEAQLPPDVTVHYEGNGQSEVGEYIVTAHFTHTNPNYYDIPSMTATLTIVE